MADAGAIARWMSALGDIAATRHLVDAQASGQLAMQSTVQAMEQSLATRESVAQVAAAVGELRAEIAQATRMLDEIRGQMASDLADMRSAQEAREAQRVAASAIPLLARGGSSDSAAWLYAAFEEVFRGPRAQIRERLAEYVPDVLAAHRATGGKAVDIGCGRGEWLELMRDAGTPAIGIDSNPILVEQCRELGLDAAHSDGIAYLAATPEATLCAVTAFHVVEHLPLPGQLQLFVAAHRALAPGGLIILETPNPENIVVGAHTFYMDPTHVHPLPPALLHFLLQATQFEVVETRRLHPDQTLAARSAEELWPKGIAELLCGPRDVAILAKRTAR